MAEVCTIGLDLAKNVFQVHGADPSGEVVFRRRLRRNRLLRFFADQQPCLVAIEACGGAHYWAREISKLGHEVRLIPPVYVKPFVKRQKQSARLRSDQQCVSFQSKVKQRKRQQWRFGHVISWFGNGRR